MRTIGHAVDGAFAALIVEQHHFTIARKAQPAIALVGDGGDVAIGDSTIAQRFQIRLLIHLRRTTDVEGTHGQLGARLTDRLRGNNADSLTNVDRRTTRQITAIAGAAHALRCLADQRRADARHLQAGRLDGGHGGFVEQLALGGNDSAILGDDILGQSTAQDAFAKRGNHRATLNDGAHDQRPFGAAVFNHHHAILRHVNQTTGEVTRVCRL